MFYPIQNSPPENNFDTALFRSVIPCRIVKCKSFSKECATSAVSVIRAGKGESSFPSNSRLLLKILLNKFLLTP